MKSGCVLIVLLCLYAQAKADYGGISAKRFLMETYFSGELRIGKSGNGNYRTFNGYTPDASGLRESKGMYPNLPAVFHGTNVKGIGISSGAVAFFDPNANAPEVMKSLRNAGNIGTVKMALPNAIPMESKWPKDKTLEACWYEWAANVDGALKVIRVEAQQLEEGFRIWIQEGKCERISGPLNSQMIPVGAIEAILDGEWSWVKVLAVKWCTCTGPAGVHSLKLIREETKHDGYGFDGLGEKEKVLEVEQPERDDILQIKKIVLPFWDKAIQGQSRNEKNEDLVENQRQAGGLSTDSAQIWIQIYRKNSIWVSLNDFESMFAAEPFWEWMKSMHSEF